MAGLRDIIEGTMQRRIPDSGFSQFLYPLLNPITDAENSASVIPVNFEYLPGDVRRYGADPTGNSDSATAFQNAYSTAVAARGLYDLVIPGGVYKISSSSALGTDTAGLIWSSSFLAVRALGKVVLNFTAANLTHLIAIDGGASSGSLYGVVVTGWPRLVGNATTINAWFIRSCHHSFLQLKAGDCQVGIRVNFAVTTVFDAPICSSNEAAFAAQVPAIGLWLDQRGAGETASYCTVINPIMEGITSSNGIGIKFDGSLGCRLMGGTSEGNKIGIAYGVGANKNTVTGLDCESNTNNDLVLSGGQSVSFYDCSFGSNATANPNIDMQVAIPGLAFYGGFIRWCNMQADHANFCGVTFSNGVSVGLKNNGHVYKATGCITIDGSGNFSADLPDQLGESGVFTPTISGATTAGTQTYSTQTGAWQRTGKRVDFSLLIQLTGNSGGAGNARITFTGAALPPSSRNIANLSYSHTLNNYTGITLGAAGRQTSFVQPPNVLTMDLLENDTGNVSNFLPITSVSATAVIHLNGSYMTD